MSNITCKGLILHGILLPEKYLLFSIFTIYKKRRWQIVNILAIDIFVKMPLEDFSRT